MDISEHRIPLDGRANVRVKGRDIDLRISTLPTIYGEKVVIRLLDKSGHVLDTAAIGLGGADLEKYHRLISGHAGVVMIVGPTGSGKSSTLYSMIRELNTEQVNLITLEDPVEYNIAGINQVQIDDKVGMTFASALRAVLRQDPDIVAVGEIRDGETADIAMRAALTGHLVLTTIHTNDAFSSIERLTDIGVPPYLTATAVTGIISQRLVRRVCPNCKEEYEPNAEELALMGMKPAAGQKFYRGRGCPMCFNSGYRGRIAVFEILVFNDAIRDGILKGLSHEDLKKLTAGRDFTSMADNCRRLVLDGTTTVDEVRRVIVGEV
jgi:type IV pilus assembly protein PilB